MNRRHFLRAAGACLALPRIGRAAGKLPPQRLFAIHVPLGMMPQFSFQRRARHVRELENRLQRNIEWENRPKPKVNYPQPKDIADPHEVIARSNLMFDLIRLALQTDSTRVVTLSLSTFSVVPGVPGVKNETHGLTHHGNEPEKIA